jgi:hypothetical protein
MFSTSGETMKRLAAGDIVRGRRDVLRVYEDQPASLLAKLIEPLHDTRNQNSDRQSIALRGVSDSARDIAFKLSKMDASAREADRLFVNYCFERRMAEVGVDFALWNRTAFAIGDDQRPSGAVKGRRPRQDGAESSGLIDLLRSHLRPVTTSDRTEDMRATIVTWDVVQSITGLKVEGTGNSKKQPKLSPIPWQAVRSALLLTNVEDILHSVFLPGDRTLIHPVPGRPTIVRMRRALPTRTSGLRCQVSLEHSDTKPVDFAVWIGNPQTETPQEIDLAACLAFSGWKTVETPFTKHYLTAQLPMVMREPQDIYLGVRVSNGVDVLFCHAYWHEFLVIDA